MKRVLLLLLFILPIFFVRPLFAQTITQEQIERFVSSITIQKDGSISVEETIEYNFGNQVRHGIYRQIPFITKNSEGKRYRMDINVLSVSDENGGSYTFVTSTEGDYVKIKIGDADKTITGIHTYVVKYNVRGALTYFSDHDELYWNVTGNEWEVPIGSAQTSIILPDEIPPESIGSICYTGAQGSTEKTCETQIQDHTVTITSSRPLSSFEGLTEAVRFAPNIVAVVQPQEVVNFFDTVYGKLFLIGILLVALFWYIILPLWLPIRWWFAGRDPKTNMGPVSAWYDPPKTATGRDLTPAETGTIIDEHAGNKELSALIVNLAQRGYLKIVEKGKNDFELHELKDSSEGDLLPFEETFLDEIFTDTVVRLKDRNLADEVETVLNSLYESLVSEKFFPENPDKVRKKFAILTGVAAITFNLPLLISAGIFGRLMPRKTTEGVKAANITRSLKNFLTSQERQLEFQAKNQMMFEKLLPFAIAFGVEKVWAERFKDIDLRQPDWYQGTYVGAFNSQSFTRSLGSSLNSFRSAATPVSSSTGHSSGFSGGSSGGGGGGGGGGSW